MKKLLCLLCALALVLSISPVSVRAATGDTMTLSSVFLRTQEGKEGIFYGAKFNLTQDTISNMACYGLALTPNAPSDDDAWTAGMDKTVLRSSYTGGLTAGKSKEVTSTSLINIINICNDTMTNNRNANTLIYVRPYIELQDGTFLYGDIGACSMKQVAQLVDDIYDTLTEKQLCGLLGMYERFSSCMKGWGLTNLKADYTAGNDLILQYRREKVVANMMAQADILWSFTGESFQYSRTPTSSGYANDTQSNVYTLYPGRIYKGIPYTHGSAGLDIYYTMGTQNSDGIYVFDNLHSSFLNGGSTDGSNTTTGAYNVARMGNDCWDAISWAYESIGSSVSADQTSQVTPTYGMYPVGPYADSLFDLFLSSNGKTLTTFNDVYATYFEGNSDNQQIMYESYALMQAGDTMVHYVTGAGGHALMPVSVNVVRNSGGTIDPDQSTVTYIEQGSGNEKAQSVAFDVDNLYSQPIAHSSGHNDQGYIQYVGEPLKCLDCAKETGYDPDTGIWTLNPGQVTGTFTVLFDTGYYIPMTSKELTDATYTPSASRISDSKSSADVSGIFSGSLSSTYRVSQITLDIRDSSGELKNTSTCFGIQNGLNSAFNLSRFVTDQTAGDYGSVLYGTPALERLSCTYQKTDANGELVWTYTEAADGTYYYDETSGTYLEATGNEAEDTVLYTRTATMTTSYWLEASTLDEGEYYYEMTCYLGNGYSKTFRSGYFTVTIGANMDGSDTSAHLVSAS